MTFRTFVCVCVCFYAELFFWFKLFSLVLDRIISFLVPTPFSVPLCMSVSLSLCLSPCLGKARFGLWDEGSEFPQKSGSLVAFLEFQHVGFRVPVGPDGLERQVFFRRRLARRFLPQGNVQNNLVYGLSSLDQSNLVVVGWIHRLQDFKRTDAQFLPPMFG